MLRIIDPPGKIVGGEIIWHRPVTRGDGSTTEENIDLTKLDPNGKEMRSIRGAEIALIPQEPMSAFSPVHTVGNQIIEAIMLHRNVNKHEARQIALDIFRDVGMPMPERRLDTYSWQLSGGLRQRAIIAMALSCNPRLLIADEPTTAVDVTTQAQVLRLLRQLQAERNSAIIFITHDLGVIAQMADYVTVMYLGLVMAQGPVDDIFHAPKHPYTKALLRSIPSMDSTPREALPTISGSIPHPFNRPRGCPFHPRCPEFMPGKCDQATPALQLVGDNQWVSCFLYHDVEMSA
jgi:peptide/nickel transport system ATP-binding protein